MSRTFLRLAPAGLLLALALPAHAYTPGTGTLFTEDFDGPLQADWEMQDGYFGRPCPWTQVTDGADTSFYADGIGPMAGSATRHWARHFLHPVVATTFSIALEYRTERGTGYLFDLDVEQRAEVPRKYRMRVDGGGALSLWRSDGAGGFVQMASTAAGTVPANQKRWLRLAIEADPSGHPRVRSRIWASAATSEPATWTLDVLDTADTLVRVNRFELNADGPKGIETWVDDLDAYGNKGNGVASSITTIWVMEMSHLDIGFTEPPAAIEAFAKSHLDQVLDNLDADPGYRWTIEEGWWLDRWWERSSEAQRQRLLDALRGGRLVLTAGYDSLHTTTAGHEELTRNLYWSSLFASEHQVPLRTWITDDVPGSTFALPELLARSGLEFFVGGMNTPFGGKVTHPGHGDRPFWWVGPDGSRVLSWTTFDAYAEGFDYGFSFFDTLADMPAKLAKKLPEQEELGYDWPDLLLMRGFDNHYQGMHTRDLVEQWNATYATPQFRLATAEEFLDHMLAQHGPDAFPSFSGDYGCAWSNSHANAPHTEAWVRQAHREARAGEALLAAGASVDGAPAPIADMDHAYRRMLEVDEHSGAGGWPGYFTPAEMQENNSAHLEYARDARDSARSLLTEGLDRATASLSAAGDAVVAVNPLGRPRDAWVRLALPQVLYDGTFRVVEHGTATEVPFQRFPATREILFRGTALPALGYKVFDLVPGTPTATPPGSLAATSTTLENDLLRITIDPADGAVTSLYDKVRAIELVQTTSTYDFNELATSTKQQSDLSNQPTVKNPGSATATLVTSGPLLAEIQVTRTGTPHVETRYRLYRNEDRLEFENVLDQTLMPYVPYSEGWRGYTVTLPFDIHNFELRTETTTRFLNPFVDTMPRPDYFDWHNVEHVMQFWDATRGARVAVDSTDAHHFETFSTLVTPSWSRADARLLPRLVDRTDEYEFEGGTVGSFQMEPGAPTIYRSVHHVSPTAPGFDPAAASKWGFEALTPVQARLLQRRPGDLPPASGSFFAVDAPGVLLYTAKPAHDGDGVILRMTELTGTAASARVSSTVLALTDPQRVEQDEDGGTPLAMDGGDVVVPLGPYETATVRVRTAPGWSPIALAADKDAPGNAVVLSWTGGTAPYTLERAPDPSFSTGVVVVQDEVPATTTSDPVLNDGQTWYYRVR